MQRGVGGLSSCAFKPTVRHPLLKVLRWELMNAALAKLPPELLAIGGLSQLTAQNVGVQAAESFQQYGALVHQCAEELLGLSVPQYLANERSIRARKARKDKVTSPVVWQKCGTAELWDAVAGRLQPSRMSLKDADLTLRKLLRLGTDASDHTTILLEATFNQLAVDADGRVDSREHAVLLSVLCKGKGLATASERLDFALQLYDGDGDGFLTVRELYDLCCALSSFGAYQELILAKQQHPNSTPSLVAVAAPSLVAVADLKPFRKAMEASFAQLDIQYRTGPLSALAIPAAGKTQRTKEKKWSLALRAGHTAWVHGKRSDAIGSYCEADLLGAEAKMSLLLMEMDWPAAVLHADSQLQARSNPRMAEVKGRAGEKGKIQIPDYQFKPDSNFTVVAPYGTLKCSGSKEALHAIGTVMFEVLCGAKEVSVPSPLTLQGMWNYGRQTLVKKADGKDGQSKASVPLSCAKLKYQGDTYNRDLTDASNARQRVRQAPESRALTEIAVGE